LDLTGIGCGRLQSISASRLPAGGGGIEPWVQCARYASLTLVFVVVVAGSKAEAVGGIGLPLSERRASTSLVLRMLHAGNPTLDGLGDARAI